MFEGGEEKKKLGKRPEVNPGVTGQLHVLKGPPDFQRVPRLLAAKSHASNMKLIGIKGL